MNQIYKILLLFSVIFSFSPASFGETSFVIFNPGGPASHGEARTAMAEFSKVLSQLSGQKVRATYFSNEEKGLEFILKNRPGLGIISPFCYLRYRTKLQLKLQLQVKREKSLQNRYYLLVEKKSSFKTPADLKNKNIFSHHFNKSPWLSLLFFKKTGVFRKNSNLIFYKKHLRAIRKLAQGKTIHGKKVHAVLLDSFEWNLLNSQARLRKKYALKLKVLAQSAPMPTMAVVTFGTPTAETLTILKALQKLPANKEGQKLLKLFTMDEFVAVQKKAFLDLEKLKKKIQPQKKGCSQKGKIKRIKKL